MTRAPGEYSGLTVMQAELLSYLRHQQRKGYCPSYEEMREHLGLASKNGINRLIVALVERGYADRMPGRARAIRVVDKPAAFRQSAIGLAELAQFSIPQLVGELTSRGLRISVA